VYDAAVAGATDDRWGERVVAILELRPGVAAPTLAEIHQHCDDRLARYKLPRAVFFEPVRRTAVGKLDHVWAKARVNELSACESSKG
jgi:acyl-CoA synthetase (AMP-forming)/AMP-acid ligase II